MSRSGLSKPAGPSTSTSASLSNVVSSLVRAQHGLTAREGGLESETDLDRHVADLLLKDAKAREERVAREKGSYWRLSDDEEERQYQSKTNKRFLKSMLRNLEDHNKPLIRPESRKEQLDAIRARDRAEREARRAGKETSQADVQNISSRDGSADPSRSSRQASEAVPIPEVLLRGSRMEGSSSSRRSSAPSGFAAKALAQTLGGQARASTSRLDGSTAKVPAAPRSPTRSRYDESRSSPRDRSDSPETRYADERKGKERAPGSIEALEPLHSRSKRSRRDSEEPREDRSHKAVRREGESRLHGERHDRTSRDGSSRRRQTVRESEGALDSRERYLSRSPRGATPGSREPEGRRDNTRTRITNHNDEHSGSRLASPSGSRRRDHRRRRSPSTAQSDTGSSDTFVDTTEGVNTGSGGGSKMDKYFSSTYNPALDVSVADLTDPRTGLIAEGNFEGWDAMLSVLKQRKEDRVSGASKAQEEERERQIRKLERKHRREERELRRAERKERKRRKRRRRESDSESGSDSDGSSSSRGKSRHSSRSKSKPKAVGTVNIAGFEYVRQGGERAWDMGKDKMQSLDVCVDVLAQ